jgi:DNA-binding protein H-NS
MISRPMKSSYDLDSRSIEELWALHQAVLTELSRRIVAQHNTLNVRLRQLGIPVGSELRLSRRPQGIPAKYRNPKKPK